MESEFNRIRVLDLAIDHELVFTAEMLRKESEENEWNPSFREESQLSEADRKSFWNDLSELDVLSNSRKGSRRPSKVIKAESSAPTNQANNILTPPLPKVGNLYLPRRSPPTLGATKFTVSQSLPSINCSLSHVNTSVSPTQVSHDESNGDVPFSDDKRRIHSTFQVSVASASVAGASHASDLSPPLNNVVRRVQNGSMFPPLPGTAASVSTSPIARFSGIAFV